MIICKINGESFNSVRATKIVCNRLWKMVKAGIDTQICIVYQTIYNLDHSVACSYVCGARVFRERLIMGRHVTGRQSSLSDLVCVSYCVLSTDFDILWSRYEFESYGKNSNGLEGKGDGNFFRMEKEGESY